ncbi:hypothetical protein LTR02_007791 [Friedmanniomyces endolithicus]|nr:hypothetical protein LTR94_008644 [Friedmanniomyces endolithicus]KAK0816318.1 hypothetical protein LTR75_003543 [Friedmanniomyces endolithicus]KAK0903096.1 hypothetical protein LTR02_007791 [Friedmanniomyces endolithicus]KAK0914520.1 hypothetical protein LTR57_013964 [Friedmanniomyces endolithicus]KAK0976521.1 hypothetical protein LTS01_013454 [Friedmanniomyces endolithicus]
MSVASSGSVDEAIAFATEFAAGPLELSSSAEQVSEGIRRKIQEDFAGMNAARVEERANETRVDEEVRAASAQLQEESDRSSRVPSAVEALRARQKNSHASIYDFPSDDDDDDDKDDDDHRHCPTTPAKKRKVAPSPSSSSPLKKQRAYPAALGRNEAA